MANMHIIQTHNFSHAQLSRFRELQRKSFEILERTAAGLNGGETEKEVARDLVGQYRKIGAGSFFHLPVVLFGERTALPGSWPVGKFFPRNQRLESGDSVILDSAPIIDGYLIDTSYSFCFGENQEHREAMAHLSQYRTTVVSAVNSGESFRSVAKSVAASIETAGYEAVHGKHPGEVLGHRAVKLPKLPFRLRYRGFDAVALGWFQAKDALAKSRLGRRSPLWNTQRTSNHDAHDGLWLVEPHVGCNAVGAKWEEILVIEGGRASWLDDEPPHVRQWLAIENGENYGPYCGSAARQIAASDG